jgi:hypothetical protein
MKTMVSALPSSGQDSGLENEIRSVELSARINLNINLQNGTQFECCKSQLFRDSAVHSIAAVD